jgi:hypothetical protein
MSISRRFGRKLNNHYPSILIIVISSPSKNKRWNYEKELWEKYANFSSAYNIDVIFTECREFFTHTTKQNCNETYVPGIFQKTILGLGSFPDYDFYVRTNLSTFYIFQHLQYFIRNKFGQKERQTKPQVDGFQIRYKPNQPFISGTGIVFNKLARDILVEKGTQSKYFRELHIPDDVLIGMIFSEIISTPRSQNDFLFFYNKSLSSDKVTMERSFNTQLREIKSKKFPAIRLRMDSDENLYREITKKLLECFYSKN